MSAILIRNGRILDPANKRDEIGDLFLLDGRIADASQCGERMENCQEIDAM